MADQKIYYYKKWRGGKRLDELHERDYSVDLATPSVIVESKADTP